MCSEQDVWAGCEQTGRLLIVFTWITKAILLHGSGSPTVAGSPVEFHISRYMFPKCSHLGVVSSLEKKMSNAIHFFCFSEDRTWSRPSSVNIDLIWTAVKDTHYSLVESSFFWHLVISTLRFCSQIWERGKSFDDLTLSCIWLASQKPDFKGSCLHPCVVFSFRLKDNKGDSLLFHSSSSFLSGVPLARWRWVLTH